MALTMVLLVLAPPPPPFLTHTRIHIFSLSLSVRALRLGARRANGNEPSTSLRPVN